MKADTERKKGPASDVAAAEIAATNDERMGDGEDTPQGDKRAQRAMFRRPGLTRMRTAWKGEEAETVRLAEHAIRERLTLAFVDAYEIMEDLFGQVREPELDGNGDPQKDGYGFVVWKRRPGGGAPYEDWSKLSPERKEHYLFLITTRLFSWRQTAESMWTEAMLARALWEDRYAIGFDEAKDATEGLRDAEGKLQAKDARYFGVFVSSLSRRADAVVRSMEVLSQRLRDTLDQ